MIIAKSQSPSETGVKYHVITAEELRAAKLPMPPERCLTVAEYHCLVNSNALHPSLRTELLQGSVFEKLTCGPRHETAVMQAAAALRQSLGKAWMIRQKSGVTLDVSEVEPDIAVVPGPIDRFQTSHPRPYSVELLIEISDRTIEFDRRRKLPEYAANGIVQCWLINLIDNCVEWYQQPSGSTNSSHYAARDIFNRGESVPVMIRGERLGDITVSDLIPGN